jgi:hypothetical protein
MTSLASDQTGELLKLLNEHAALYLTQDENASLEQVAQIRRAARFLQHDKVLLPDELLSRVQESWPFILRVSSASSEGQVELYHAALTVHVLGSVLHSLLAEASRYIKEIGYWKQIEQRRAERLAYLIQSELGFLCF